MLAKFLGAVCAIGGGLSLGREGPSIQLGAMVGKGFSRVNNRFRTEDKLLISTYGCASETAAQEFEWTRRIAEQKGMKPVRIILTNWEILLDLNERI